MKKPAAKKTAPKPMLDLGCGDNRREGYKGVDLFKTSSTDILFDLTKKTWPWKDCSVSAIHCSHFLEHLTGRQRLGFMEECWRILDVDAQMSIVVPYWSSKRSIQDPTHEWPPLCEDSFLYFNRGWREANKLTHGFYNLKCNFDFGYGPAYDQDIAARSDDHQLYAMKHYNNAVLDLYLTLTKRA